MIHSRKINSPIEPEIIAPSADPEVRYFRIIEVDGVEVKRTEIKLGERSTKTGRFVSSDTGTVSEIYGDLPEGWNRYLVFAKAL